MTNTMMMNYARDLDQYLETNGIYTDWCEADNGWIKFEISWGDWKHEHARADWLVSEWEEENAITLGASLQQVTEDDGSDTYSAIHMFRVTN